MMDNIIVEGGFETCIQFTYLSDN